MQKSPVILDLCLRKTQSGKSFDYCDYIISIKLSFQNYLSTKDKKPAFSNSSCLKSVFNKLSFHDGVVWMVGLKITSWMVHGKFI